MGQGRIVTVRDTMELRTQTFFSFVKWRGSQESVRVEVMQVLPQEGCAQGSSHPADCKERGGRPVLGAFAWTSPKGSIFAPCLL